MDIDFSSITNASNYREDQAKLSTTGKQRAQRIYLYIFLAISIIGWPVLLFMAIRYSMKNKKVTALRDVALTSFAEVNGFEYKKGHTGFIPASEFIYNLDLPYKTDYAIHSQSLNGEMIGYKFGYHLSSVFIKTPNGSSQWPTIFFTITLPVELPKMFIDSKFNNLPGLDADAANFEQAQNHTLEGDFSRYYNVRIEKDQHIDMLTILTPEVMEALKQNNLYDVWINGDQMVLTTFGDQVRYFAGTPTVFTNAFLLMQEIDKIARALRQNT